MGATPGTCHPKTRWHCCGGRSGGPRRAPSGEPGLVLTGLPGDELRYGGGERRAGIGGAHQLAFGHLGVRLGELQPQRLGDLGVKADALQEGRRHGGWASTAACRPRGKNKSQLFNFFFQLPALK